jgi:nucleotide-binding universal stress UspA family protein
MYLHEQYAKSAKERLQDMVPVQMNLARPAEIEVASGYAVEEILRLSRKNDADLIVMGVQKSAGIGARVSAHLPWTIASTVVCHAKCPVLTVRG